MLPSDVGGRVALPHAAVGDKVYSWDLVYTGEVRLCAALPVC